MLFALDAAAAAALILGLRTVEVDVNRSDWKHGRFKKEQRMKHRVRKQRQTAIFRSIAILVFAILLPHLSVEGAAEGSRLVKYSKQDIVPIRAKLRFSTLIILPDEEEILDFTTGDKDFWIINGAHNLCYVHPAQAGIRSNLNLTTASGHIYSFLLTEISNNPNAEPDLKVYVEPADNSAASANSGLRGYVSAAEAAAYKKELDALRSQTSEQIRAAQSEVSEQIDRFRASYASKLRFDYRLEGNAGREPFLVSAIYHDDSFTYIQCAAREKPALYEVRDGKPNLLSFQVENGVYIAPKIIEAGYLTLGKKKLPFARRPSEN
jgi:type IV secretory pathway VirB9-like protein